MNQSRNIDIAADHPAYAGHFPNFPVLPGALLLDAVLRIIAAERGSPMQAWQIASAKFLGAVRPGDTLRLEFGDTARQPLRFNVFAGERKVVSGVLHER
jgi:3-hydroxyacyl-[acyl-carrier-protein] dehydratase